MSTIDSAIDLTVWDRLLIGDDEGSMPPDTARAVLRMKFSKRDQRRMHLLAVKNQQGKLSPKEKAEMEAYVRVGTIVSLWWSKARRALKQLGEPLPNS